jgi:acyl carrier protein
MASDVRERVIKVVAETLKLEPAQINVESKFVEDLGAESMQSVELIAAFEEEFDIEMDEEEALDVKTVGKAVDFIAAHLG